MIGFINFRKNSITLRRSLGGWEVVVLVDGSEERRSFERQEHANNFIAGQMVRLGVTQVNHDAEQSAELPVSLAVVTLRPRKPAADLPSMESQ